MTSARGPSVAVCALVCALAACSSGTSSEAGGVGAGGQGAAPGGEQPAPFVAPVPTPPVRDPADPGPLSAGPECAADADCTVSAVTVCPSCCECPVPISVREVESRLRLQTVSSCAGADCTAVRCRACEVRADARAACAAGRCVLAAGATTALPVVAPPPPPPPQPTAPVRGDSACRRDSDCVISSASDCEGCCDCPAIMNETDLRAIAAMRASSDCMLPDCRGARCEPCDITTEMRAVCVRNRCTAMPARPGRPVQRAPGDISL